jgi:hypothetical protein
MAETLHIPTTKEISWGINTRIELRTKTETESERTTENETKERRK